MEGGALGLVGRDEVVCLVFALVEGMGDVREDDGLVEEGLGSLVQMGSRSLIVWGRGWGTPSCCGGL